MKTVGVCCMIMHRVTHHSLFVAFLAKNNVCVLNHPPYSPDLAQCDFYLFPKIKLKLKGCFFYDIPTIQTAATSTLEAIPQSGLQVATLYMSLCIQKCNASIKIYLIKDFVEVTLEYSLYIELKTRDGWSRIVL
ncbi:hypothetical protein LAZ67_10004048 [Cordylochernes scorpioides]|uniref:Histone-lysine N-methyltransferase SETMAR n=1 Tax=Cordylochernes scorpioides TaxID=51811 RepID=A0ABY6KXE7_9ARAC|nr:hypothetical protein LAZ67_10004048 [Cordylochernes scorpioides]